MKVRNVGFALILVLAASLLSYISVTGYFTLDRTVGVCDGCNLLVFTIDTLRADHLSSYGYFQKTTPAIDSLVNEGVIFTRAFSQIPHTPPSHWSIFTGLYPYRHGKFMPYDNGTGLTTISDVLKDNGYVTSGFISSKMLIGFTDEFDYFNGYDDIRKRKTFIQRLGGETTDAILSWLSNHSSERFFLWVHFFDPHSPYEPPEDYDMYNYSESAYYSDPKYDPTGLSRKGPIRYDIAKYDGEVRYVDENVGTVLKKLEELGLEGNTLVVLVSDHGECFGEHMFSDFGYDDDSPCLFHGKTLYDQEIRIPLMIRIPGFPLKGLRVSEMVETVDLFPTILDILNVSYEGGTDGESLVSLIEGKEQGKEYAISQTKPRDGSFSMAMRTGEWKFVIMRPSDFDIQRDMAEQEGGIINDTESGDYGDNSVKKLLFRMDEGELWNFYETEPEISLEMENELKNILKGGLEYQTIEMDHDTETLLRSLGYI